MAQLINNDFSQFQLSAQEELTGRIFAGNQKYVLQNRLAMLAQQKLNMKVDLTHPRPLESFAAEDAFLTGQLELLRNLLVESEDAETTLVQSKSDN